LQTPSGTALAWTGATVFGDCTAYLDPSIPDAAAPTADATAVVSVRRPGRSDDVTLTMRRRGGGWVVVRTPGACLALGCP
jgi:hypothetical protein